MFTASWIIIFILFLSKYKSCLVSTGGKNEYMVNP